MQPNSLPELVPNIILILCDDLGYADLSYYGATAIQTPNIDALGDQGLKCTNFYASSAVCSPSRAGILTGRYAIRAHVPVVFFPSKSIIDQYFSMSAYSYGIKGLSIDEITLPEVLKKVGYATGMLGKWHLGDHYPFLPNNFGFDFFFGALL